MINETDYLIVYKILTSLAYFYAFKLIAFLCSSAKKQKEQKNKKQKMVKNNTKTKSFFQRALNGAKEGWNLNLLPDYIVVLNTKLWFKVAKLFGAISVGLVTSGIAYNFNAILFLFIFNYNLAFIFYRFYIIYLILVLGCG